MTRLDSIADPTRLAVARRLAAHPGSSAPAVADATGVHLNTARAHLSALIEAGLAERVSERIGVGRPRVRYRLTGGWQPRGDELLGLSTLLAAALVHTDASRDELRGAANRWGRRWASELGSAPVEERLVSALQRLGFGAEVRDGRLEMSECPCPLVATDEPALICGLVDAVVEGVLEGSGATAGRRRHDPAARHCSTDLSMATE